MKDSSQLRKEFERLKEAYENAQKRKKKAKSAYKSQMKALKSQMKPYRLSYKQAQLAEHEAKVEYKSLLKELKRYADDGSEDQVVYHQTPAKEAPTGRGRYLRKPKAEPVAAEKPAGRRGRRRAVETAPAGGGDDLTKVLGVGAKVAAALQANGINSFADMAATSIDRYKQILKENRMGAFRNPATWAQQAAELGGVEVTAPASAPPAPPAPKEPKRRGRQPGAAKAVETAPAGGGDDLTRVLGVGAKVAAALQANGIHSFADMAATSFDRYKQILKENRMGAFRDPSTWAQQAADLAGVEAPAPKEPKRRGRQPGAPKAAVEKPVGRGRGRRKAVETAPTGGGDDLTKVLGVGDKVADALRANGITSFADMAATTVARYKEILKENGMSKFRNPTTWAQQAADFAGVAAVQEPATPAAPPKEKGRRGRKAAAKPAAAPAAEGEVVKKRRGRQPGFKPAPKAKTAAAAPAAPATPAPVNNFSSGSPDDLTKIKGVGDRVQVALNDFGIYTYADVARTSLDRFKEILKARGMSKFRDPSGWAQHAAELTGK